MRAFINPTANASDFNIKERLLDSLCSGISQIAVSLYKDQFDSLFQSRKHGKSVLERLFESEKNIKVKKLTVSYIKRFSTKK